MTQLDDTMSNEVARHLRQMQEAAQSLLGAPGPKALLRRFGEALQKFYGAQSFDCGKVTGRGAKRGLKRRNVGVPLVTPLADELLKELSAVLPAGGVKSELREGFSRMHVAGQDVMVAIADDPHAAAGTVVAWQTPAPLSPVQSLGIDSLVRTLQNEGRWLKRFDRTQAMLYRDEFTNLYNYRYLEIALDAELLRGERFGSQFCLLFIDLDGFKHINDQHGHQSGSSVLKQVADVLRDAVREVDIPIRYGGDEFVILLLGATCAKGQLAAERVRRHIEAKEFRVEDGSVEHLTCSIGVAAYPEHGRDRKTLLKMADETMYNSKRAGKNRVTVVSRTSADGEA